MSYRKAFITLCSLLVLASGAAASLEEGLVAHLPLKNDLRDHSANPHPVEVSGRVELRDGAAWFAGKEDWLELPFIPLNERPFAMAVWLKPTGAEPTYGVLEQRDRNVTGRILHLMIRDGLRPWFGFYVNDVVSPVSLSNRGDWQHMVFQYDGTHQQIWINGRLICRRAAAPYRGTAGKTCIGKSPRWPNVPSKDYEGWMSDFRLYSRVLTFEEIAGLAATPPAPVSSRAIIAKAPPAAQPAGSVAPEGASDVPLLSIDGGKLQLRGRSGEEYIVEASADLVRWEEIGSLVVPKDGVVDFVDEDVSRYPQRFYRIRYQIR